MCVLFATNGSIRHQLHLRFLELSVSVLMDTDQALDAATIPSMRIGDGDGTDT